MQDFLSKFSRYFMTGGVAAIVDAGGFGILHQFGVSIFIAASASFILAAIVNFILSSFFVFNSKLSKRKFYKFFCFALLGLAINVTITLCLTSFFKILPIIAKVLAIGSAFVLNFLLNMFFVFKDT
jgi:putative flippase GtrA